MSQANLVKISAMRTAVVVSVCTFLSYQSTAAAQSDVSTPSLNATINQLRLRARVFPPERGEVREIQKLGPGAAKPELPLNRHLSLFVTDVDTTKAIKFSEVMEQLVKQSGDTQLTKELLFNQWWDTAGQGPGLGLGPHCDDGAPSTPSTGIGNDTATSVLNGFPYRCPRLEASEATSDPFSNENESNPNAYSAIAFINRFDLLGSAVEAPTARGKVEFPDCGEYRIIFARNSGQTDLLNRNLIIFEARIPNPKPIPEDKNTAAPVGCLPILDFWHDLSEPQMTAEERGQKLHDFYLHGKLHNRERINPVVNADNYTFGSGQIRTNQFMLNSKSPAPPFDWTLREFKALKINGTLVIVPDTVKSNPAPDLFAVDNKDSRISALSQAIRAQMKSILGVVHEPSGIDDVNSIGFFIAGEGVNAFESDEKGNPGDPAIGDIMTKFAARNDAFVTNIQNALKIALPQTTLTSLNVVDRIRTQTCAGCHQFSDSSNDPIGLGGKAVWPDKRAGDANHPKMPFTQVSEILKDQQEAVSASKDGKKGKRWAISTTVECLLDAREKVMDKALGLPTANVGNHCPQR